MADLFDPRPADRAPRPARRGAAPARRPAAPAPARGGRRPGPPARPRRRRSARCSPRATSARSSSGGRPASARPRSPGCSPTPPTSPSCRSARSSPASPTSGRSSRPPACAAQNGRGTLLFVDEIHRFNKAQQDAFLPLMEDGTIVLVGATTENPSFELNAALLSRARVLTLRRLDEAGARRARRPRRGRARPPAAADAGGARRR